MLSQTVLHCYFDWNNAETLAHLSLKSLSSSSLSLQSYFHVEPWNLSSLIPFQSFSTTCCHGHTLDLITVALPQSQFLTTTSCLSSSLPPVSQFQKLWSKWNLLSINPTTFSFCCLWTVSLFLSPHRSYSMIHNCIHDLPYTLNVLVPLLSILFFWWNPNTVKFNFQTIAPVLGQHW